MNTLAAGSPCRRRRFRGIPLRAVTALMAGALVVSGATLAFDSVGTGGQITTCFSQAVGTWRPIDSAAGARCKSGEVQIVLYTKAGADSAFLAGGAKAADADTLDGIDSTGFLGVTGKAADAETVDGIDSTDSSSSSRRRMRADTTCA